MWHTHMMHCSVYEDDCRKMGYQGIVNHTVFLFHFVLFTYKSFTHSNVSIFLFICCKQLVWLLID
jgi:hypothetical protein